MSSLLTPEHLHLALNHTPLIGLAIACIPLLIGLIRRDRSILFIGVLISLLCSASIPLVMESGEAAALSFGDASPAHALDDAGIQWIGTHSERADKVAVLVYAVLAASIVQFVLMWKWRRFERIAGGVVLILCAISVLGVIWVADAGGKIRHPEFRGDAASTAPPGAAQPGGAATP